jgi:predicted ATPase
MLRPMGSIPIQRFKLQNFKSIGPTGVDLEFAPLTILIGPNGAGKTSVLEAIGLVVQSANLQNRSGLQLDGALARVESEDLAFHGGAAKSAPLSFDFTFSPAALGMNVWWNPHAAQAKLGYALVYGALPTTGYSSRHIIQSLALDGVEKIRAEQQRGGSSISLFGPSGSLTGFPTEPERILSERLFGQILARDNNVVRPEGTHEYIHRLGKTASELADALKNSTTLLTSTRGADLYVRSIGDIALTTGRFGEGTVRVLSALQADVSRAESFKLIQEWAAKFGLPSLTGGWIGRDELRLQYLDPNTKTALPISMAGAGSKHILPFIVECFVSPKPRLIMVDEPEQGLHPAFQLVLAELLAKSIERGNQLILCTQSPTLVLAVCALVAKKTLAREEVAVYSLERRGDETKASRNEISASGAIEGGWFQHFAKAERELLEKFLPGEEDAAAP